MSTYVSDSLREQVALRAEGLCEYCLIAEEDAYLGCQVEHIISEKHDGPTEPENLAYACLYCNRYKGSDLGSVSRQTGVLVRFFNPRIDRWADHFVLSNGLIVAKTEIGECTARILRFNHPNRIQEREVLRSLGRYPNPAAENRMYPA